MGQSKPPESRAAQYRRHAEELREMARNAKTDEARREYDVLAEQYEKLARDILREKD